MRRLMLAAGLALVAACSTQSTTAPATTASSGPVSSSSTTTAPPPATDPSTSPPTTEMSLAAALCSDLAKGLAPIQLYGQSARELYPTPERFAVYVYGAVKRECPEQLRSNEALRAWLTNWNLDPDA